MEEKKKKETNTMLNQRTTKASVRVLMLMKDMHMRVNINNRSSSLFHCTVKAGGECAVEPWRTLPAIYSGSPCPPWASLFCVWLLKGAGLNQIVCFRRKDHPVC